MSSKRVLVADDDEFLGRLVQIKLELAGYDVIWRDNGNKAWESFCAQKPELVILDVMMPELTGLEVLEKIRAEPEFDSIPVILLSAKGQEGDVKKGLERGATEYMIKPFRPAELLVCVNKLISA